MKSCIMVWKEYFHQHFYSKNSFIIYPVFQHKSWFIITYTHHNVNLGKTWIVWAILTSKQCLKPNGIFYPNCKSWKKRNLPGIFLRYQDYNTTHDMICIKMWMLSFLFLFFCKQQKCFCSFRNISEPSQ